MKVVYNHRAQELHRAIMLTDGVRDEVQKICNDYFTSLSVTVIIEKVADLYGSAAVVYASFILGQLIAINQNNLFNLNLVKCQREN